VVLAKESRNRKPIIGLAGGICAGKTLVGKLLGQMGCAVIDCDQHNRELLRQASVREALRKCFGDKILDDTGQIDRQRLAQLVFNDQQARRQLEGIVHPLIEQRCLQLVEQYNTDPTVKAIVIDAPLLFEVDLDKKCDKVIFVEADESVRQARAHHRGWERHELTRREKNQLPLALKRLRADYIICNNCDVDACRHQVANIFSQIISSTT